MPEPTLKERLTFTDMESGQARRIALDLLARAETAERELAELRRKRDTRERRGVAYWPTEKAVTELHAPEGIREQVVIAMAVALAGSPRPSIDIYPLLRAWRDAGWKVRDEGRIEYGRTVRRWIAERVHHDATA